MLIKKHSQRKNKAVAPVIATLLMIAVAVAMSVIIFMWSQGFLAGTSESTGSQQGSQNQAAQSSISIETVTGTASDTAPKLTLLVRNVGAISINVGSITITGLSSNSKFVGSLIATVSTSNTTNLIVTPNDAVGVWKGNATTLNGFAALPKGGGLVISLRCTGCTSGQTRIASGDVVTVKITTDKGTFAQQSYTVP